MIVSNFRQLLFYGSSNLSFYGNFLTYVFLIKGNSQNSIHAIVCQSRDLLVQQTTNRVYQHPWSRSKFYGLRQYFNYVLLINSWEAFDASSICLRNQIRCLVTVSSIKISNVFACRGTWVNKRRKEIAPTEKILD